MPPEPEAQAKELRACLESACIWEARARKAGNVHPDASFVDLTYQHFAMSAYAASMSLSKTVEQPIGESVLDAIRATRRVVPTNTNLGIVLLLAPLSKADPDQLKSSVRELLERTTIDDSANVFEAIRIAAPGGLGEAKEQDVRDTPTLPLRDIMALAADRDMIASQYADGFKGVFGLGVGSLVEGWTRYSDLERAIQHSQLCWLAAHPDSLILRKRGEATANEVSQRAKHVLDLGGLSTAEGQRAYQDFDVWLRADGHARNPGTTADLIAASLFVAFRERKIPVVSRLHLETRP